MADLYSTLMGLPTEQDQMEALAQRLRRRSELATLGVLSGDPVLGEWGGKELSRIQEQTGGIRKARERAQEMAFQRQQQAALEAYRSRGLDLEEARLSKPLVMNPYMHGVRNPETGEWEIRPSAFPRSLLGMPPAQPASPVSATVETPQTRTQYTEVPEAGTEAVKEVTPSGEATVVAGPEGMVAQSGEMVSAAELSAMKKERERQRDWEDFLRKEQYKQGIDETKMSPTMEREWRDMQGAIGVGKRVLKRFDEVEKAGGELAEPWKELGAAAVGGIAGPSAKEMATGAFKDEREMAARGALADFMSTLRVERMGTAQSLMEMLKGAAWDPEQAGIDSTERRRRTEDVIGAMEVINQWRALGKRIPGIGGNPGKIPTKKITGFTDNEWKQFLTSLQEMMDTGEVQPYMSQAPSQSQIQQEQQPTAAGGFEYLGSRPAD